MSILLLFGAFFFHNFRQNHSTLSGFDRYLVNPSETQVQLMVMDESSGGTGFKSKSTYGSGLFRIRMKIPEKRTHDHLTRLSLNSGPLNGRYYCENLYSLGVEFFGTNSTLHTYVYNDDGSGFNQESFNLWFDPSEESHGYDILWNSNHIVIFVDDIPIRVFKNNGISPYPDLPMSIEVITRNGDWGRTDFQEFGFNACNASKVYNPWWDLGFYFWNRPKCVEVVSDCDSSKYFWNRPEYRKLSVAQEQQLHDYRTKCMTD